MRYDCRCKASFLLFISRRRRTVTGVVGELRIGQCYNHDRNFDDEHESSLRLKLLLSVGKASRLSRDLHNPRRGGRVVMQRPAKPWTPVRFRPPPPKTLDKNRRAALDAQRGIAEQAKPGW